MPRAIDLMVVQGYALTTAEILYYLPDRPSLIAPAFVWQQYDLAPDFPQLRRFLAFWTRNIEGRLHSVKVASQQLIRPAEFRLAAEFRLH